MDGVWMEDGSFRAAPGAKGKLKGKGKGKGKGKDKDGPALKKPRVEEEPPAEPGDEVNFEQDWKDKQVCLVNLKAATLNGTYGVVKEYLGSEDVLIDGKIKKIRRFLIALEEGKGEKSIKFENLFKVMTGSLVKLRGLDSTELNDSVAECGRLDAATMRYDVVLSDGRHIKVKPSNVEFMARYEASQVAGDKAQMDRLRAASSLRDQLTAIEEFQYPVPQLLPASALAEYAKKFPKSVVIGKSNAANPKGAQVLLREVTSAAHAAPGARVLFASVPRDRCVWPPLAECRHDELLRLGKFAEWVSKRCAPRPVYFMLPGITAKGPAATLSAATCAWPLYVEVCHDVVVLDSERWKKSPWARLDALLAVWGRKPLYLLPEKYQPPVELPDASGAAPGGDAAAGDAAKETPLTFRPEEPFTISRPVDEDGAGAAAAPPLLGALAKRAEEAEGAGGAKVRCPCLAIRRLG